MHAADRLRRLPIRCAQRGGHALSIKKIKDADSTPQPGEPITISRAAYDRASSP